jgi:lipopolysaccharide/colanic/teichoic acid biosynthesis glycosyltransferase
MEANMRNNFMPFSALPQRVPAMKFIEPEQDYLLRITQECRRAERSRLRFVLALVDGPDASLISAAQTLAAVTREIDVFGWYSIGSTLGILFGELGGMKAETASEIIVNRIKSALSEAGQPELLVNTYVLPRDLNHEMRSEELPKRINDYLEPHSPSNIEAQLRIKRVIDLVGAALLLIALLPIMAVIALVLECVSPGPVLFKQTRVGKGGERFTLLKYRSMTVKNDASVHETYVKQFIHGTAAKNVTECGEGVFKLTHDLRVTPFGKFLRRTSLDELPQLWNVLRGEMSLVGPRPPIPYEVECYELWHQRRVLEVKPGITGLWQVLGRSRTGFDEMVRLDLQYSRTWSLWLDLKILLQTPRAIFGAGGAH